MKKIIDSLKDKVAKDYFILVLLMISIGVIRNYLEMIGWLTESDNYHGIYPTIISLVNTVTYVFLMIIAEGFLLNKILRGTKDQLRKLIREGSFLLLYLFIIIPLLNNLFNYHFLKLPIYFDLNEPLFPLYGPVGILTAFALVLIYLPIWLKKIYQTNYLKRLTAVLIVYLSHFVIYYQLAMIFCFRFLREKNIFTTDLVNIYSNTYLIPVLIVYPFFTKEYYTTKRELHKMNLFYFFLWLVFISLFFIPGSWFPKN